MRATASSATVAALAALFAMVVNAAAAAPSSPTVTAPAAKEPDALIELALRYEHAEGVQRDYDRAVALFCEASDLGSGKGAYNLAVMRLNGRGLERSERKAVYWLEIARARAHSHAAVLLGRLHVDAEPDRALCGRTSTAARPAVPAEISAIVSRLAPDFQLDPDLVTAVIAVESGYRVDAVSRKNAQGLMQLIPATAARFGVADPFDPAQNIRGGMMYLRFLLRLFDGDVTLAFAAYNAGEGAVIEHGGVPPYPETKLYLQKLRRFYDRPWHPMSAGDTAKH
jgi:soluble lytic murein transglycosylase-like protein